jgi:hypothetical protein
MIRRRGYLMRSYTTPVSMLVDDVQLESSQIAKTNVGSTFSRI